MCLIQRCVVRKFGIYSSVDDPVKTYDDENLDDDTKEYLSEKPAFRRLSEIQEYIIGRIIQCTFFREYETAWIEQKMKKCNVCLKKKKFVQTI